MQRKSAFCNWLWSYVSLKDLIKISVHEKGRNTEIVQPHKCKWCVLIVFFIIPVCLSWEAECPQSQAMKGQEILAKVNLHTQEGKKMNESSFHPCVHHGQLWVITVKQGKKESSNSNSQGSNPHPPPPQLTAAGHIIHKLRQVIKAPFALTTSSLWPN